MNRARKPRATGAPRSPHFNRKSTCPSRKVRYVAFDQATSAARRVSRHVGPVRVYQCPDCDGFHLTRIREWKDPHL